MRRGNYWIYNIVIQSGFGSRQQTALILNILFHRTIANQQRSENGFVCPCVLCRMDLVPRVHLTPGNMTENGGENEDQSQWLRCYQSIDQLIRQIKKVFYQYFLRNYTFRAQNFLSFFSVRSLINYFIKFTLSK